MKLRRGDGAAVAMVAGWYGLVWLIARPISHAPVVDDWLYVAAARVLAATGRFRPAGFMQAEPIAQLIIGAAVGRLFGFAPQTFDSADAAIGAVGAIFFYALARRCGAACAGAIAATALLLCNPCYTFLSFSFMTEVPFLAALIGSNLAFASGGGRERANRSGSRGDWLGVALAVIAFMIRPFAGAAIIAYAAVTIGYDAELRAELRAASPRALARMAPFAAGLAACAAFWWWLMIAHQKPWALALHEDRLRNYFMLVPARVYAEKWLLGPLLYLGFVLSPIALVAAARRWRPVGAMAVALFAVSAALCVRNDHAGWGLPQVQCFAGWPGALELHGMALQFGWRGGYRYAALALASVGAAALCVIGAGTIRRLDRTAAAVMLTAAIYWAAALPLWFFGDRYDLVMVPAGCLMLALAWRNVSRTEALVAAALTLALGLGSAGGLRAYNRGTEAVLRERNLLLAQGIARSEIDAGYGLDGADLYRYAACGIDQQASEAGIPMVTSYAIAPYTIAGAPLDGTEIIGRFSWPGPFGFGVRPLYVLRRVPASTGAAEEKTAP